MTNLINPVSPRVLYTETKWLLNFIAGRAMNKLSNEKCLGSLAHRFNQPYRNYLLKPRLKTQSEMTASELFMQTL